MITIVRIVLLLAAPIAALFVAREATNFGVVETLVATALIFAIIVIGGVLVRRGIS
jgi:hypothetical protein